MTNESPPLQQLNRTFIGSVLFIDIVGYACRTVPEQIAMKEVFNGLLIEAVQKVVASDRIMVDTGDGAGVAFLGDPEDALFAALSLRDAIDAGKASMGEPGFARMGINLGPLKIVRDINGHTNMIGDAVNDAQRVMSFAEPGQVMVSHSYYDIISRFSVDYAKLFSYEGIRHDKHVREHQVYRFGPSADAESLTEKMRDRSRARYAHASEPSAADEKPASSVKSRPIPKPATVNARFALITALIAVIGVSAASSVWNLHTKTKVEVPLAAAAASGTSTDKVQGSPLPLPATNTATAVPVADIPASQFVAATQANLPANRSPITHVSVTQTSMTSGNNSEKATAASTPATAAIANTGTSAALSASASATTVTHPDATPVVMGKVNLSIQPWGEIYVDGSSRGISPPLKSLNLLPGKHKIEIHNSDFAPYKQTIQVKSNMDVAVRYVF